VAVSAPPGTERHEHGIRQALAEALDNARDLLRLEVNLATLEARQALGSLRRGLLLFVAGALIGMVALQSLALALIAALATRWPLWASAGVVGVALGLVALALAVPGLRALRGKALRPDATLETVEETRRWLETRS
jgi:TRAP-type C4-dicarboxylate transport system permease small subunit